MPELLEVESYRRLADRVLGRRIASVDAPDAWFVKGAEPEEVAAAITGLRVAAVRRRGKLLVLDLDDPDADPGGGDPSPDPDRADPSPDPDRADPSGGDPSRVDPDGVVVRLGLRFGMTGRLLVDGAAAIDRLEYSSGRDDPGWDRFALHFTDGTDLRLRDPRRLGGVSLDPDEDALGVDALTATRSEIAAALAGSAAPLKARLMDQARVAGVGNLLADEVLWRAGLDPGRPARSLGDDEVAGLHGALGDVLRDLGERGGSHTGDVRRAAGADGRCPRDGAALVRRRIGGRTTVSCPVHQR